MLRSALFALALCISSTAALAATPADAELFGSSAIWRFGIRCWPEAAVSAYQHAADLGSDSAAEELANLHSGGMYGLRPGVSDASSLPACDTGAQPASHPESAQPATAVQTVPDTLTDAVRADILSAVVRANSGWAAATQSLDASSLNGAVAGQELANDQAELAKLRSQGQTRKNVNTAFAVTDVTLDAPGHATVRTHETWYAETYQASSGRLLQRTAPTTYDETYTVEYLTGSWIVTKNDL
jgi:hypothetical protein